jgi:hypothetical protein
MKADPKILMVLRNSKGKENHALVVVVAHLEIRRIFHVMVYLRRNQQPKSENLSKNTLIIKTIIKKNLCDGPRSDWIIVLIFKMFCNNKTICH